MVFVVFFFYCLPLFLFPHLGHFHTIVSHYVVTDLQEENTLLRDDLRDSLQMSSHKVGDCCRF